MSRLANKTAVQRAPQTAEAVPELPDFNAEFAQLPGGQQTNAALQKWWDRVRQRIEFTNGDTNSRFRSVSETVNGLTASVEEVIEVSATTEEYLEARWTLQATAGPVATGMTLFSASGPDTNISYIAFQADRFQVNTSSGNKQIFSASATEVKLGNVLTVDLVNTKLFVGTGTYGNANTYWYVDTNSGGRMSLGSKFLWDGSNLTINGSITATTGTIGGWSIGSTTLTGGNALLDSAGQLVLGTSNDVVYVSATDSTYRLWIGNATSGSAAFRVTKTGVMTATNGVFTGTITSSAGTIAGFNIASDAITAGSVNSAGFVGLFSLTSGGALAFMAGRNDIGQGPNTTIGDDYFSVQGTNGGTVCEMSVVGTTGTIGVRNSGGTMTASMVGSTGAFVSTSLSTANFQANIASAVDVTSVNLRVFNGGTQTFRVDYTNGDIYINNTRVVRAQYGTPYPGGGADAAGLWAKDCLIYHGLGV